MTGHKAGKSALRDRLHSNSPDPIKSSILRESGMGWNSPPSNQTTSPTVTSPLRISKRESPERKPIVARRSSSSYKHVHSNNLVSKSPFKSQIPTPSRPTPVSFPSSSPRRVSGEKRPRPLSMHEGAEDENERPFALKRERKQSKGLQGLIHMEPVTKSPFRRVPTPDNIALPPPPIKRLPIPSFAPTPSNIPTPTSNGPSPTRSSLVSKRMHGPRLSGRRERRKTVTFDERCDVVEFDREDESDVFESDSGGEDEHDDPFFQPPQQPHPDNYEHLLIADESYESIDLDGSDVPMGLDPDSSITGLVDEMFGANNAKTLPLPPSSTSTPPQAHTVPNLEKADGSPYGRTPHVEHHPQHQYQPQHHSPPLPQPHFTYPFTLPTHTSPKPPATPPRRVPVPAAIGSPPLGRSTHLDRVKAARIEEGEDEDVGMLPASPSPKKRGANEGEGLVPRFGVQRSERSFFLCSFGRMMLNCRWEFRYAGWT